MIGLAVVGGLLGVVLFWLLWLLVPRTVSPLVQVARYEASVHAYRNSPPMDASGRDHGGAAGQRLGAVVNAWLTRRGITFPTLAQDVALTGRSFEAVLARKVLAGVTGFFGTEIAGLGLRAGAGVSVSPVVTLGLAVVFAAGLFMVPDLETRREAAARRRQFRRALGSFLDLVALQMAGSAAPAEALPAAASTGSDWSMVLISDCLYRATVSGRQHWEALAELGTRIGVRELVDLGALIQLVDQDGARVRETLIARAATMRRTRLADIEARAGQRDQSMLIAQIVLGMGFIVFLAYPALIHILLL